jgi:hypothetical protein
MVNFEKSANKLPVKFNINGLLNFRKGAELLTEGLKRAAQARPAEKSLTKINGRSPFFYCPAISICPHGCNRISLLFW